MRKLERLLNYRKFSFSLDGNSIIIPFFKHKFVFVEESPEKWAVSVLFDQSSNIDTKMINKAFVRAIKMIRSYKIDYFLDNVSDI